MTSAERLDNNSATAVESRTAALLEAFGDHVAINGSLQSRVGPRLSQRRTATLTPRLCTPSSGAALVIIGFLYWSFQAKAAASHPVVASLRWGLALIAAAAAVVSGVVHELRRRGCDASLYHFASSFTPSAEGCHRLGGTWSPSKRPMSPLRYVERKNALKYKTLSVSLYVVCMTASITLESAMAPEVRCSWECDLVTLRFALAFGAHRPQKRRTQW